MKNTQEVSESSVPLSVNCQIYCRHWKSNRLGKEKAVSFVKPVKLNELEEFKFTVKFPISLTSIGTILTTLIKECKYLKKYTSNI